MYVCMCICHCRFSNIADNYGGDYTYSYNPCYGFKDPDGPCSEFTVAVSVHLVMLKILQLSYLTLRHVKSLRIASINWETSLKQPCTQTQQQVMHT